VTALQEAIEAIKPLDSRAMAAAQARIDGLTKPPGSLGRLEDLAVQLAGMRGQEAPSVARRTIVVVAADHGIARRGVSAYPPEVTAQMVANYLAGGAAINVLARLAAADVLIVDAGVATPIPDTDGARASTSARLVSAPIRAGTADMSAGPAMTPMETMSAIDLGLAIARELADAGMDVIGLGEMGIGNTTAASALVALLTDLPVSAVTGRGTGIDDHALESKVALIEQAIAVNSPDPGDPLGVLSALGGLEIATLVGLILGAAAAGVPVILDGFITGAAALVAACLCPALPPRLIASHRSVEPGHGAILERLGLRPLLELDLRLGEGTGGALALGLLDAACAVRDGMATFVSAGVSGPAAG
jgi:nicotinate-nucleotide--dimethylbenzimidazole phosphoribosyltransferase